MDNETTDETFADGAHHETRLQAIVDTIPDLIIVYDADGVYKEISSGQGQILVADREEMLGKRVTEFLPEDPAQTVLDAIEQTIETGESQRFEYHLSLGDREGWFEGRTALAVPEESDEPEVMVLSRDITERKKNEQRLENFSYLFENTGDCIVETEFNDGQPIIKRANAAFEETFGYSTAELKGRSLDDVIVPADQQDEARAINQRWRQSEEVYKEVTREAADGTREFLLRSANLEDDTAFAIYTDITEQKEHERQLERTKEKLQDSNKKLEQFAYVASHDLQEPLRMVSSYMDLLESELGDELDDETEEYFAFAIDGAERMRAMIDGLLQYSRVQTRADSFEVVDASAVLGDTLQDLELTLDQSDAVVEFDELPTVRADRNQLGQVFQNLIKNAIEHGGEGIHIEITATERPMGVEFAVTDDGPGIPAYRQEEVFDIFEKGQKSDGTGIGLAVCQEIVDRHDGDMWVESTDGDGTTFYFVMPHTPIS